MSRRDLLRALVRSDEVIGSDVLFLSEEYTGDLGCGDVEVTEGVASIRRTRGEPGGGPDVEARALRALARTVGGVVAVRTPPAEPPPARSHRKGDLRRATPDSTPGPESMEASADRQVSEVKRT